MVYKSKEPFLREYGVRNTFFCEYFKKEELAGNSQIDILTNALREKLVKSLRVLDYTYGFYEKMKDQIGWVKSNE